MISPSFDDFERAHAAGAAQVVYRRLVADLDTPVSAMLKIADGKPNSFLLESVEGGDARNRYSIIGLNPDAVWRARGDASEINRKARFDDAAFEPCQGGALASLRAFIEESRIDLPEDLPPMAAGVFGYMGYDMVRLMERLPDENPDALGLPDGLFVRPTIIAVFDSVKDEVTLVTPVRPEPGVTAKAAYARAEERLNDIVADFDRALTHAPQQLDVDALAEPTSNTPKERYFGMVERAKEYIAAGDIFQVVLSQRFETPFTLPPFSLYRALRRINPSPFLYFLNFADFAIVGSSPEILVRVRNNRVTIRPIAGTRHRGKNRAEDEAIGEELLADPKERAEHLMLLDLGRNDVGRVSKIGSVEVTEKFALQLTSHLIHIVSNVEGNLDPSYDAISALVAGFPAGTVSGAPKVRAMEIIDELELEKRGPYAGCVGYFSAAGEMDTCIVLRTAIVKDGKMYVQAGGGVVADSSSQGEYDESVNKAKALFRAADEAVRYASQAGKRQ
ncbi:MAG: anthranilate synthase component I [Parvibaculum sp.]|uniref:anthranilate synthase component I n=1 Tax=Parvibaculum sp. TaxID=2024848 RepID=UPI001D7465BB|nr:anthranilate synthase component I [Parvibaculum sp.]MBX3487799.1 anthranilate synthase component I [Parvibaculum sp.]MBX3497218.1 anthranilate synthase component I [Parvibaculum sp.]MCW5729036.1 anthranilate synthase component I [Parvibaculum sp.]